MATQPNTLDLAQIQGIVGWLEEQHRNDRETITRLAQEVERLALLAKEQATQLVELRASLEHQRAALERLPLVDEALKQGREQIAELTERFDENVQHTAHALLLRAADAERDRKQVTELTQTVGRLEREDQGLSARLKVVADEQRRDRAQLAELPKTLDEIQGRVQAAGHRSEQVEESARRLENLSQAHSQELEAIRGEQTRAVQWRQLADLKATRQVAEWQQLIENWRNTVDEQQRPVQYLTAQLAQLREETRTLVNQLGDQGRRQDDFAAALGRMDVGLSQARDTLARLEQASDAQRRRFDEQASAQLRLDEAMGRGTDQRQALEAQLQTQGRVLDDVQSALRAAEAAIARTRDELSASQTDVQQRDEATRAQLMQTAERLDQAAQTFQSRVLDFERMSQEHRQRLALELEQQSRELAELAGRFRPA